MNNKMDKILAEISAGELIDKITILEIKKEKIKEKEKLIEVVKELIFSDHYEYSLNDFEKIRINAKNENLKILTTEKDYVKIPEEFKKEIDFITMDLIIQNEEKFIELLNN